MRQLAMQGGNQHRGVMSPDYLIGAAAQSAGLGLGLLHYDSDFDALAPILGIQSRWIAPRGSLA